MKTRIVTVSGAHPSEQELSVIREAGAVIAGGGLVAFPTETVYGLGGNALDQDAARKIYAAKGRPSDNPLIVHIADPQDLERVAYHIPDAAWQLAAQFWPGPLTMVLEKQNIVPCETTGGLNTVAVRLPSLKAASELIRAAGGFVAAPSANRSGRPSPTRAVHCIEDLDGVVDMIIDGGESVLGLESTVVDMTVCPPAVLRPGFITADMLREALRTDVLDGMSPESLKGDDAPKAPGMKYRHYAPAGDLAVVTGKPEHVVMRIRNALQEDAGRGYSTGVICAREDAGQFQASEVIAYGARGDAASYAGILFDALRRMDEMQIKRIYAQGIPPDGVGAALMNRLCKAAGYHIINAFETKE